jgi:hypothetical protein
MNRWQKIKTAPKNGAPGSSSRWLLLFGSGSGFAQCVFVGYWGANGRDDEECWREVGWRGTPAQPTHWQRLPEPPE